MKILKRESNWTSWSNVRERKKITPCHSDKSWQIKLLEKSAPKLSDLQRTEPLPLRRNQLADSNIPSTKGVITLNDCLYSYSVVCHGFVFTGFGFGFGMRLWVGWGWIWFQVRSSSGGGGGTTGNNFKSQVVKPLWVTLLSDLEHTLLT